MAELRWGAATDPGQIRPGNEDHLFAGPSLFVVADGMGGHQAGEVAAQLAVGQLESRLTEDEPTIGDLVAAIGQANRDIFDSAMTDPDQQGMGTTITSLAVMADPHDGEVFALANVGDSRTYLFRHGRLRQLTVDHSYVQELVAAGHISREEARSHPRRNIVTRALGIESTVQVDSWAVPIIRGDRFLLCSDGLVDEVHDDEITEVLASIEDPQEAADDLVRRANANGGRDNITVVVVDVLEGDDPPDPTEELDVIPAWAVDTASIEGVRGVTDGEGVAADPLDDPGADDPDTDSPDADSPGDEPDRDVAGHTDGAAGSATTESATTAPITPAAAATSEAAGADTERVERTGASDTTADDAGDGSDAAATTSSGAAAARRTSTFDPEPVTATVGGADDAPVPVRARRGRRLARFATAVAVAAVAVLGFTIFAAWARDGYFVAFDDQDQVTIFRGRAGGVLWFDPTVEAPTPYRREQLEPPSITLVDDEPRFDSFTSAETFVRDRLVTTTTSTTTTTTTTTVPPTTTDATTDTDTGSDGDGSTVTGTTTGS